VWEECIHTERKRKEQFNRSCWCYQEKAWRKSQENNIPFALPKKGQEYGHKVFLLVCEDNRGEKGKERNKKHVSLFFHNLWIPWYLLPYHGEFSCNQITDCRSCCFLCARALALGTRTCSCMPIVSAIYLAVQSTCFLKCPRYWYGQPYLKVLNQYDGTVMVPGTKAKHFFYFQNKS